MEEVMGCPFCGQTQYIEMAPGATEQEMQQAAAMQCKCSDAVFFQRTEKQVKSAKEKIQQLFSEGAKANGFEQVEDTTVIDQLERLVELVGHGKIRKVSVAIFRGGVANIQYSGGKIKVQRTVTRKASMEADEQ